MLEPAVVVLRLIQYAGAMVLFGSSLFLVYALPSVGPASAAALGWPRRALAWSAGVLAVASLLGMLLQTAILAGSISEALKPESIGAVVTTMSLGPSSLVRGGVAIVALSLLVFGLAGRGLWLATAAMGAVACGSFAWMGHGAATPGLPGLAHVVADIFHLLAAGLWIGALAVFLRMLSIAHPSVVLAQALHRALGGFSGLGSAIVAVLILTGLVNSWFLVGPAHLSGLVTTPYGWLLSIKLLLFGVMLVLAAMNRFRLTPALAWALSDGRERGAELAELRRSLLIETAVAFGVLALVAWLGSIAPISAI
jgi:putative copper resistance protein D